MQENIGYLNWEDLLVRSYDFIVGFNGVWATAPEWLHTAGTTVVITGMGLSLVLLVLLVYAQIRLLQTEHAGFHAMEEREREHHAAKVEATHRNDRWERVTQLASSASQSDWRRAILEADIMLGDALATAGDEGPTIGDQLKMANPMQLTTLDLAWAAHKVRNEVAHGGEQYMLGERDMRATIDYYKRVFEELGVI